MFSFFLAGSGVSDVLGNLRSEVLTNFAALTDRLLQLENTATYNLVVDVDVDAIGADSKRAGVQVVDVLTAIDPEVGACVGRHAVN